MEKITIFDSTLRDGAQAEGISFSVEDKLKILETLDKLGIDVIEAGNPGSNPKDISFFDRIKDLPLTHAKLCAFGSTRRPGIAPADDANVQALLEAGTPIVAIFGKSWVFHVKKILKTTREENLSMIEDTISYLTSAGKTVYFDAEHFFDGYKDDPDYALSVLAAAERGGAKALVLCDTNGGTLPAEIQTIIEAVKTRVTVDIGIHCHNDCGMAVANSVTAVEAGARQVQGTFLGFGERCGNANLSTMADNWQWQAKLFILMISQS